MAFTKIAAAGIGSTETVTLHSLEVLNNATVGGVLTYEDVTNVDSVGLITARNGIVVGSGITLSKDGDIFATGVTTTGSLVSNGAISGTTGTFTGVVKSGTTATGVIFSAGDGGASGDRVIQFKRAARSNDINIQAINSGTGGTNLLFNQEGGDASFAGNISIADKIIHVGDTNTAIRFPSADTVSVETGGTEALRVDSSQRLVLGATSQRTVWGGQQKLSIEGLDGATSSLSIVRNSNDAFYPFIALGKSRGTSDGSSTIVQDDDVTGIISFNAADGGDMNPQTAYIESAVDGTPGTDDMPGRLSFYTTADGSYNSTERLRISSTGKINIGDTQTSQNILNIEDGTAASMEFASHGSGGDTAYIGVQKSAGNGLTFGISNRDIIFKTGATYSGGTAFNSGSERFRITSGGDARVGSATSIAGLRYFDVSNTSNAANAHGALMRLITSNAANTGTTSVDIVKYKDGNFYISNNESSGTINLYAGGATRMTVASTGYITTPQQPYVMLGLTANQAVAQSTTKEVIWDSVMYDTASGYNSSNGRYTCPVIGDYLITFDCQYTGMVNAFHLGVGVNGTNPPGGTNFDLWNHTGDSVRGDNIARVIRITATTQYISFFTYTTSGGNLEPNRTKATIKFLG